MSDSDHIRINDRVVVGKVPPTAEVVQNLAREGFRSVVNLRTATEENQALSPQQEGEAVRRAGMEYQRLRELDHEWDVERTLEGNAATLALTGVVLGATRDHRWLYLSGAVAAFLLHQGWCPPLPILRRLAIRTTQEINAERTALKALRGDFQAVGDGAAANHDPDGRATAALAGAWR